MMTVSLNIYMYMKEKYTKNPLEEYNNIKGYISNTPQTHGGSKTLYLER
jgi:hypothetical protein